MKPSNYNFFFPYEANEDKVIAYNSYSNALALMDKPKYEVFQQFVDKGITIDDDEFVKQLAAGNFIIEDDCNELDRIRLRMLQSRFSTSYLSLTIAPTADCNFRCPYCYEKDVIKPEYMTQETEDAIVKFVEARIKTIGALSIMWYEGEPLMNIGAIERLSRKFINLCAENNTTYSASMITNGYFLNRNTAQLLTELKIASLQITLDGGEETHNKRRPLANGMGTFDTILSNLVDCEDVMPRVSLRINIDKNNVHSGKEVTGLLREKGLLDKVTPYLGKIMIEGDSVEKASCFDSCGFSKEEFAYYDKFTANDMYMNRYPRQIRNYCGADSQNSYVIAADGKMYKCWHEIGDHTKCVGSVVDNVSGNENVRMRYLLFDPTTFGECSKCNLLPVCMGGCPYYKDDADRDVCSTYKFVLDNFLGVIAGKLKQQKGLVNN